jgi:hypothetical protein
MNDNERGFMAQEQTLTLSRRLIPGLLSLLLLLVFIGFMIGYFLGVKYTTDEFVTQIRQETLADQLLVSSVGNAGGANGSEPEAVTVATAPETESASCEISDFAKATSDMAAGEQPNQVVAQSVPTTAPAEAARYSAELIGFGTKAAAQEFIKRVSAYNPVALELKERHSKTARGKVIKWYQVVTGKYEQKQELQKQLDTLIKKERLQDIKIVAFAPNPKDKDIA